MIESKFIGNNFLKKHKTTILGMSVVGINPTYTSQICSGSGCGEIVKKA
jgi:hypothetical protein